LRLRHRLAKLKALRTRRTEPWIQGASMTAPRAAFSR